MSQGERTGLRAVRALRRVRLLRGEPADLELCAEHGLGSDIELLRASQVNGAYERVLACDVRYRSVVDASTPA